VSFMVEKLVPRQGFLRALPFLAASIIPLVLLLLLLLLLLILILLLLLLLLLLVLPNKKGNNK